MAGSIESFSLALPSFQGFLAQDDPVMALENALIASLPDCERLLRWAVTRVTPDACQCEGAYLKR